MTEKSNQSLTKRGFNLPHVFDRSVIILLVVYALVLIYDLFTQISDGYYYYDGGIIDLSIITFVAGVLVSLVQFRFLQVKTKCITILSLGESRKSLFRKKFWFPLLAMALITVGYYIILLCTDKKLKNSFSILADEYFANILIALLPLVAGYTVGVFARIVSGKTSETIVFGASVCALPFTLFNFIDSIFALSLRGYYVKLTEYSSFSNYSSTEGHPITTVFSLFDPLYTLNYSLSGFGNQNESGNPWFETPAFYIIKNAVWISVVIFAVFLIEKYFIKNFKAEFCDKAGKNKFVRITSSVGLSLATSMVTFWRVFMSLGADVQSFLMLPLLITVMLLALITTVVVTSVLYRKKEQLRFSFQGVGITAVLGVVVYLISVTGCFGYSTYMPDTNEIKSVMINDSVGLLHVYSLDYVNTANESLYVDICFKSKEEIEKVKDVHNFIAKDKNYDSTDTFTIIYELENGDLVYRSYPYLSNEACEKIGTLYETDTIKSFYKTIFNQNSEINGNGSNAVWLAWEKNFSFNNNKTISDDLYYGDYSDYYDDGTSYKTVANADSLVVFSKDDKATCITDEQISRETMEKLKKALYEDYECLSWQQFFKPEKQIGVISLASCATLKKLETYWLDEDDPVPTSHQVLYDNQYYLYNFSVTSDMVNTISVLKDAGVYKCFDTQIEIEEAHLIDSSKFISWISSNSSYIGYHPVDKSGKYLSGLIYSWNDEGDVLTYLDEGCNYINLSHKYYEDYGYYDDVYYWYDDEIVYDPIPESDIEIITPEEAEKLREKAFMTYNAGNDCKFLVMKYTDGTANMLVIPN